MNEAAEAVSTGSGIGIVIGLVIVGYIIYRIIDKRKKSSGGGGGGKGGGGGPIHRH